MGHSKDLVEVIGKKLSKKYQEGTVLVVLVEQAESIVVNELDDFIRTFPISTLHGLP